jgi:hypothetical protein
VWVTETVRSLTQNRYHDDAFWAEREINLDFGDWRQVPDRTWLTVRARVRLLVTGADATRAVEYDSLRRAAQQTFRVEQDRLAHLRTNVLNNADAARRWWLDRHSSNLAGLTSWTQFDKVLLPLVGSKHDPQSGARRAAAVLMEVVRRLDEDPRRYRQLASTAAALFQQMGWSDLANSVVPQDDEQPGSEAGGHPPV